MHRRSLLQLGLTGAIATAAPPAFAQSTGRTFDAADFGAVGDGETINTRPRPPPRRWRPGSGGC